MPKEKKAKEVKLSKEDQITALIKKHAYKLFDREPNGSVDNDEVAKLSKEIVKNAV